MPWRKTGTTHCRVQLELPRQESLNQRTGCLYGANGRFTRFTIKVGNTFQGEWRGLEPKAPPSGLEVILTENIIL